MCLLFIAINTKPNPSPYKLILASNRDEFFQRPTKPADFWAEAPHIIGGMDLQPGREGGTWLALNKETMRIGALLNILCNDQEEGKEGRGALVRTWLESEDDGGSYFEFLRTNHAKYNPFNLVGIDLKSDPPKTHYFSNKAPHEDTLLVHDEDTAGLNPRVSAFGCSLLRHPFKKVEDGRVRFTDLVATETDRDRIVDELLKILKDETRHYPDPQMKRQVPHFNPKVMKDMSCRFINMSGYGTRTHTIILVTKDDIEYLEWTRVEDNENDWLHSSYKIQI